MSVFLLHFLVDCCCLFAFTVLKRLSLYTILCSGRALDIDHTHTPLALVFMPLNLYWLVFHASHTFWTLCLCINSRTTAGTGLELAELLPSTQEPQVPSSAPHKADVVGTELSQHWDSKGKKTRSLRLSSSRFEACLGSMGPWLKTPNCCLHKPQAGLGLCLL